LNSRSPRRPACCCSWPPGARLPAPPSSIAAAAAPRVAPGCSSSSRPRWRRAAPGSCPCRGSVGSAPCAATTAAGRRWPTRDGSPSRWAGRSRCCAAAGGCSCAASTRAGAATGSGSTRVARPADPIARSVASCGAPRRVAARQRPTPQRGRPATAAGRHGDGVHVLIHQMAPERELSRRRPVYPAHDTHAPRSNARQQDSRPGRRA
jgi:hypothetical protein